MNSLMRYGRFTVLSVCVLFTFLTCGMRAVERAITLRGKILQLDGTVPSGELRYTLMCTYDSTNEPPDSDPSDAGFLRLAFYPWLTHTLIIGGTTVNFSTENVASTFSMLTGGSFDQDTIQYSVAQRYNDGLFNVDWNVVAPAGNIFPGGNTNLTNPGIIPVGGGSIRLGYTISGNSVEFSGEIESIDFSLPSAPPPPAPPTAQALIEALSEEIRAINAGSGITSSLDAKLSNALAALENIKRKDNASATRMMFAFINAVEAQRGKELTDAQATQLVSIALAIIDLIK